MNLRYLRHLRSKKTFKNARSLFFCITSHDKMQIKY
jgi:hypothetical protein